MVKAGGLSVYCFVSYTDVQYCFKILYVTDEWRITVNLNVYAEPCRHCVLETKLTVLMLLFSTCDANVRSDDFFVLSPCTVTRGHKYKLYKHCNTARVRAIFFKERVINIWNSLPDSVNFNSYYSFRRTVKRVKFTDLRYW